MAEGTFTSTLDGAGELGDENKAAASKATQSVTDEINEAFRQGDCDDVVDCVAD